MPEHLSRKQQGLPDEDTKIKKPAPGDSPAPKGVDVTDAMHTPPVEGNQGDPLKTDDRAK